MQHERPKRVLLYARVSGAQQEKHGTSLEGQDVEGRKLCRERGYPEPVIFVEVEGGGAEKQEKRTEQRRLMAEVQPGDLVLCCKQDRWSRHTLHFLASTAEITAKGAKFYSISERFDPSTPEGKFASTMMAAGAEMEHARIKDRTVGTRRRLREAGLHVEGLAPIGYKVVARHLVIDPQGATLVKRMFELSIAGESVRQIATQLLREFPGTRGIDGTAVARHLKDRRYLGESNTIGVRGKAPIGEWIKSHDPIIDQATWRASYAAVAKRKIGGRPVSGESRNADFLLRGLVYCGSCGRVMVAHAPGPTGSTTHDGYYLCQHRTTGPKEKRCDGPIARSDKVDAQLDAEVLAHVEELAEILSRPPRALAPTTKKKVDHNAERERLIRKQERLIDAIGDGTIERSMAKKKMLEIENELEEVEQKRFADAVPMTLPAVDRTELLGQVKMIRSGWARLTASEKRPLLKMLIDRIELHSVPAKKWTRGAWKLHVLWREIH